MPSKRQKTKTDSQIQSSSTNSQAKVLDSNSENRQKRTESQKEAVKAAEQENQDPEDEEYDDEGTEGEANRIFQALKSFVFRHALCSVYLAWWFNLNFSPLYLHGYVFAIHQEYNYTENITKGDIGEGAIVEYQEEIFPRWLRYIFAIIGSLAIWLLIRSQKRPLSTWGVYGQSMILPTLISMLRCQYEAQRIITEIHCWFYYYIAFLGATAVLSFHFGQRPSQKSEPKLKTS